MDIASGLAFQVDRWIRGGGGLLVLAAIAALLLFVFAVVVAGLLPAASEPVTVAPLRWG